ncbi:MAG: hypothetical protein DRH57_07250 [Candidatus Cloacimonadota bacterium]|nr:MAG: hypothetical protein DRH57_07250 [Candidatus Cloacimonadota bacterium]
MINKRKQGIDMKLGEILYEADYDTYLARETEKHNGGSNTEEDSQVFEVDFVLFDEAGEEIEISNASDDPSYPDMIEVEVTGIESYDENPNPRHEDEEEIVYVYDDAEVEITKSAQEALDKWLETRSDYKDIGDFDFDVNFDKQSGTVSAIATDSN